MLDREAYRAYTNLSDEEIIGLVRQNDQLAFDVLVLRHKDKIFNTCFRYLSDYEEARDIAQEVFIKAYRGITSFKQECLFSTWIYRIAINVCKNRVESREYKQRRKQLTLEDQNLPNRTEHQGHELESLIIKERQSHVQRALNSLVALPRQLLILRDIEELSYEEIVQITGLKIGTLKSKLSRARNLLAKKLTGVMADEM